MANEVNIRQQEYGEVAELLQETHQQQQAAIQAAVLMVRSLLESGFHVEQTSRKLILLLDYMEQKLLPEFEKMHQKTEQNVEQLIAELEQCDLSI